jgi:phosphohistidine phosphatase
MHLYLVRHATAYSSAEDPQRPLNSTGKQEAAKIAQFFADSNAKIDHVFHSTKARSEETAQIIAHKLDISASLDTFDALDPDLDIQDLITAIPALESNTLLVGHLPNIGLLAHFLLNGNLNRSFLSFEPATAVALIKDGRFWTLDWFIHPNAI